MGRACTRLTTTDRLCLCPVSHQCAGPQTHSGGAPRREQWTRKQEEGGRGNGREQWTRKQEEGGDGTNRVSLATRLGLGKRREDAPLLIFSLNAFVSFIKCTHVLKPSQGLCLCLNVTTLSWLLVVNVFVIPVEEPLRTPRLPPHAPHSLSIES